MKYFERKTWPLTSCTTPYSGIVWDEQHRTARLATALHRVRLDLRSLRQIEIIGNEEHSNEGFMVIVGYSASKSNDWEAIAFMDTEPWLEKHQSAIDATAQPRTSDDNNTNNTNTQDLRVSTQPTTTVDDTTATTATPSAGQSHRRTASGDSLTTSNMVLVSENSVPDLSSSIIIDEDVIEHNMQQQQLNPEDPRALLILRHQGEAMEFRRTLDFRPLAPTLAEFSSTQGGNIKGVFAGSSDQSELFWFVPDSSAPFMASSRLSQVKLNADEFQVSSCILAIDFVPADKFHTENTLGFTCQDGTIRLVSFEYDEIPSENGHFKILSCETFILDGPLACIRLSSTSEGIKAQTGSLCGYACELVRGKQDAKWGAPRMIAQDFMNSVGEEDCVMAVCDFRGFVCLGLLSGRLLLFQESQSGTTPKYLWRWECKLPHSIHGIEAIYERIETLPHLLVTTRWSIHVMAPVRQSFYGEDTFLPMSRKPSFFGSDRRKARQGASNLDVALARTRLADLCNSTQG